MGKLDDLTAQLTGASSSGGEHQRWVNANIDPNAKFMTLPISGGLCKAIVPVLKNVETVLQALGNWQTLGIRSVSGYQGPPDVHGYHSWGLAIDINYVTNPYIMHENGEAALDAQLRPVFNRISRFMIKPNAADHPMPDSVIPALGTGQTKVREVYLALQAENQAMKDYFALMQDGQALKQYLDSREGTAAYNRSFLGRVPGAPTSPDAAIVQRQMRQDWTVLTSRNPLPAIVAAAPSRAVLRCPPNVRPAPPLPSGMDRPFDGPASKGSPLLVGRSPLNGYLDLSWDLVNALVGKGFVWGALGFGAESGDIMHFDARNLTSLSFDGGKGTIGGLVRVLA